MTRHSPNRHQGKQAKARRNPDNTPAPVPASRPATATVPGESDHLVVGVVIGAMVFVALLMILFLMAAT